MKKAIAILAVLSLAAFAGQIAVDLPVQGTDGDWLRYDNGTANWYTWGGMYRATWFNTEDFIPGFGGAEVLQSEIWFYHGTSKIWDTSDVYIELWNGDSMGPVAQLDQTMLTAVHYAPVYATYSPGVEVEANFWLVVNTEMSAEAYPSSLGDGAGSAVSHSYYSDDLIIWEPWIPPTGISNYFMAVEVDPLALDGTTWGSLKATF